MCGLGKLAAGCKMPIVDENLLQAIQSLSGFAERWKYNDEARSQAYMGDKVLTAIETLCNLQNPQSVVSYAQSPDSLWLTDAMLPKAVERLTEFAKLWAAAQKPPSS